MELNDGSTPYIGQNASGSAATMLTSGTYGQTVAAAPSPAPAKAGYTFTGWYAAPAASGSPWAFGIGAAATMLTEANGVAGANGANPTLTLRAGFTANAVPLVYHANHGADAQYAQTPAVRTDDAVTAKTYAQTGLPARTGYVFQGWADSASAAAADPAYAPGGTFAMPPSRLDLHAVWTATSDNELRFDKNAGDALPGSVAALTGLTYGRTVAGNLQSLPMLEGADAPSRANYSFMGWSTKGGVGNVADFSDASTVNWVGAKTVYAVWQGCAVDVRFYNNYSASDTAQHAAGNTANAGKRYGDRLTAFADPVRAGFAFQGWYTAQAGGTRWDFASDTVATQPTLELYAAWTENNAYSVVYDLNGATSAAVAGGPQLPRLGRRGRRARDGRHAADAPPHAELQRDACPQRRLDGLARAPRRRRGPDRDLRAEGGRGI